MSMKSVFFTMMLVVFFSACSKLEVTKDDWPQYKKDNFRSGVSNVDLDLRTLDQAWTYKAPHEPAPAWYGPAKEDAYALSGPLPSMRDYDLSYYPVVVGEFLYYGSSSDDAVHCINTNTGKEIWQFTTSGPVRVAPTFCKGYLYFGSDDGYVYCIDAQNAKIKWKYSPSDTKAQKVLNNGRFISYWPVRTGVLVEDDMAYFGASLLPWKQSYICAINASNGSDNDQGCYVEEVENMTMEGSMASTGKLLVQPQGRIAPAFITKATGEKKGQLPGTGGCFVLVTPDKHIVHPKSSRAASIQEYVDKDQPEYLSFKGGKEMVIKGDTSYIISDHSISAFHRKTKKTIWVRRNYEAHRIIQSGNALYVGSVDTIFALNLNNGLPVWKQKVNGVVHAIAVANNALYVSTNEGFITCFKAGGKGNALFDLNCNKEPELEPLVKVVMKDFLDKNLKLHLGPEIVALSPDSVKLSFQSKEAKSFQLKWISGSSDTLSYTFKAAKKHQLVLPVRKSFVYHYDITDQNGTTGNFEYNNFLNFKRCTIQFPSTNNPTDAEMAIFSTLKAKYQIDKGLALVLDESASDFPLAIAQSFDLDVIALNSNERDVKQIRNRWQEYEVYSRKLNIQQVTNVSKIPISSDIANMVWVSEESKADADEVIRLIAPRGVAFIAGADKDWLDESQQIWQVDIEQLSGGLLLKKHPLEVEGEWTHQYGRSNNSAFGGESLWGSTRAEDFDIQWMGRPGPRFQTDRSSRKPSPLAINGRMFTQGNQRIVALNVHNGSILWSKELPGLRRMNTHRDCSNWVADNSYIYVAKGNKAIKIDAASGQMVTAFEIPNKDSDWGYIGLINDLVIGSRVPQGASYTVFHGGYGWYDALKGDNTNKVVSQELFAHSKKGQDLRWKYQPEGHIINSTISMADESICFVQSSNKKLSKAKRGGDNIFKHLQLVKLDAQTGKLVWKHTINNQAGITMYSMAMSSNKIVIVSSTDWNFMIYTYDAQTGKLLWEKEQGWFHGDHGQQFSRPAIVGNRLVVKPVHYNLETGEAQNYNVPKSGHGCASYALTEQAIFYRGGSVTQFNFDTREFSRWERLRPDCWLSTIPAQGMVLSPEGGGGCSCGNWLETSMVLAPKSRAPITIKTYGDKKPDYKKESWGEYAQRYQPNEFVDSLQVEAILKPGLIGAIYYTIDGSEPTEESTLYTGVITIYQSATLKVAAIIEKDGLIRKFVRDRSFVKLRPVPTIERQRSITKGSLQVKFQTATQSGKVYYTLDGSVPTSDSNEGSKGVMINGKTLLKARTVWLEDGKEYSSEVVSKEIEIPEFQEAVNAEIKAGIQYEYYEGEWKKLPDFKSIKAIKEGVIPTMNIDSRTRDKNYGFRFKGYLNVPVDGIYTFYTACDDGSYIFLHNKKFIDDGGNHGPKEKKKDIALKAGLHPISIIYYQVSGGQAFSESIEGPNMPKQAIPANLLFHN
jgi:outer membrane protein assembly factor BamB